jgi:hypothetical protein
MAPRDRLPVRDQLSGAGQKPVNAWISDTMSLDDMRKMLAEKIGNVKSLEPTEKVPA